MYLLGVVAIWGGDAVIAACSDTDCSSGCKEHNRWCTDTGGYRYAAEIAVVACVETPDNGNAEENDTVSYDKYVSCDRDCTDDLPTTGAPNGNSAGSGSETAKTVCQPGG